MSRSAFATVVRATAVRPAIARPTLGRGTAVRGSSFTANFDRPYAIVRFPINTS
jgi:hypothetical protein